MIPIGVGFLAIIFSIMIVNWAHLRFEKTITEIIVFIILIIVILIGLVCLCIQGIFHPKKYPSSFENNSSVKNDQKKSLHISFFEIKLFALYFFGSCYIYHSALHAYMHCSSGHVLGVIFNGLTICYVFLLFVYFSLNYNMTYEKTPKCLVLAIIVSNICIWMDTIFSELMDLSKPKNDQNVSTVENITLLVATAEDVIEKTDPFLLPATIEFSLITIDVLFSKKENVQEGISSTKTKTCRCTTLMHSLSQLLIFILCFALFSFTFSVVVTNPEKKSYQSIFLTYDILQLILKAVALILISFFCINTFLKKATFKFSASSNILLISYFGNIVFHVLYVFALFHGEVIISSILFADNIISICMGGFQVYVILGFNSKKFAKQTKCIHYICCLLGMINLGLWISDSIGEERRPVFSIVLSDVYGQFVWKVINKLILPLTIFFRFHIGVHFLDLYWERHLLPRQYR